MDYIFHYIVRGVAKSRTQLSDFRFNLTRVGRDLPKGVPTGAHRLLSLALSTYWPDHTLPQECRGKEWEVGASVNCGGGVQEPGMRGSKT